MSKNSKKDTQKGRNNTQEKDTKRRLKQETKYAIYGIISFLIVVFLIVAPFNGAGMAGSFLYSVFSNLFGYGYIFLPIVLALIGISFLRAKEGPEIGMSHAISGLLFLLASLGILDLVSTNSLGGMLGTIVAYPFEKLFDTILSILFLGTLQVISLIVIFDTRPVLLPFFLKIRNLFTKKKIELPIEDKPLEIVTSIPKEDMVPEENENISFNEMKKVIGISSEKSPLEDDDFGIRPKQFKTTGASYVPPPLSLLEHDKGKPDVGDIKGNSNIIKRTLANFGIVVEMDEITVGPTVTRYALKPAEGVKLSRIIGLQDNIALALAAHPIRIEAPIPGKSLVGIEIPNKVKSTIGLGTLLADPQYQNSNKPLLVPLGRGLSGKATFGSIAKMPHALIAGTTGSGKSVTIHSIITSLLYRNGPEDLRFIFVDPKRVELTLYNGIPHLLTPVVTDAKKTILALKWAAKEMERRYDVFEKESIQNIAEYHAKMDKGTLQNGENNGMPYIVIIIDELADIMTAYPRELESAIVRLAQMSRAVGIHLILSTQRPEVQVITGLIKANIPARVALKVRSGIDSRTILDTTGAEKLLGYGDMLYSSGEVQPERLQSAFISGDEVRNVVKYLKDAYKDELPDEINLTGNIGNDKSMFESTLGSNNDEDEFLEDARAIILETGKASTSYLQRRLSIGYSRAAKLIDMLEQKGVVGPANGSKAREVFGFQPPNGEMPSIENKEEFTA